MDVVLVHPEIANNTGAIIRLCANTGARLHLVEPLGFSLDDSLLKRAGLDYHEHTTMVVHESLDAAATALPGRWWGFSSQATTRYTDAPIAADDTVVFGAERAGLDAGARHRIGADRMLTIPMQAESRSLNLANAVSVVVYDTWRRQGFPGAADSASGLTTESLTEATFDP
ncbi:MAG: tRNA (cytidine(34)-2'-O)-methyltransferase [Acidimicrobiales bacterium]|nr:tRNA (cytidine(34)-2'-O)-methyltransferase [Acidimicrobiales bacterium]